MRTRLVAILGLSIVCLLVSPLAYAQKKTRKPAVTQSAKTSKKKAPPATTKKPKGEDSKVLQPDAEEKNVTEKKEKTIKGEKAGANEPVTKTQAVESKNKDGAKVFKFGEMEIEGRLKSPQIVYFLRRVRAEFSAGDLGHRPFVEELAETARVVE